MNCPHCQTDNPADARYCKQCGAALSRRCPNCGAVLPADARFCTACGHPVAEETPPHTHEGSEAEMPTLVGERRVITALLADVKGSTALAERVDTEVWVEIMNRVFQVLGAEIYRYGGEIDQYRGDGLVAFFGVPTAHEDDPERALLAALAMQAAVQRYAAELAQEQGVELLLRVGVNTGEVIAAQVGDRDQHSENTAMGRAIALAARMESAAAPGTVLATENTYRLVAPLFQWQALGEITVKGVSQPLTVYRPLRHRPTRDKARGIEGLESPLVGRDAELHALQEAVERLGDGLGGIVTLVGEAGLGKSRLVAEIRKSANLTSPNLRWLEGRCLSYATDVAYGLWIDGLRALLEAAPDTVSVDVRGRLRKRVQALCPERYDEVYPYLGRLLSLPLEEQAEARLRGLEAEGLKVLTFRAVGTLIQRVAQERPLVVVCEDLHWADATSLELLEYLMPLAEHALLLVCVLRPEREHGCWQIRETAAREYPHRHSDLWLEPLSQSESGELVRNLLCVEELPTALREQILERGDGNPFYVEEILRSLIDGGIVAHDEETGCWRATQDVGEISIPDTLQGVLRARIDRLPAEARRVLQSASVIGRIFSYRVLEAVVGSDPPSPPAPLPQGGRGVTLDTHLLTLQREQMIRELTRTPERQFTFKHYLTVEAAYSGILRRERRVTHRRVAEALERLYSERGSPGRAERQLGLLAHHWEQAGETQQAVQYLRRAGEQAAAQYANTEAVAYVSRALALTPAGDLPERYVLLLAREQVLNLQGDREAQQQDLVDLERVVESLQDDRRSAQVALRKARYLLVVTNDRSAVIPTAREAIRLARLAGDVAGEAEGYWVWGRAIEDQRPDSISMFKQALELARAAHYREIEIDSLRELGLAFQALGDPEMARTYHEHGLHLCREIGKRMEEGRALDALGLLSLWQGNYEKAQILQEQGLRICRETGNRRDEGWALFGLGLASYSLGDYAGASTQYEAAANIFQETGDPTEGMVWIARGWLALELDEKGDALEYSQRGMEIASVLGGFTVGGTGWLMRGHTLAGLGHLSEGADAYRKVLTAASGQAPWSVCEALAGLARVSLAQGEPTQALAHVERMLDYLDSDPELYGTLEPVRVYLTCYRVLQAVGDARAQPVLEDGYQLLQEREDKIEDCALRRSFLENVAVNREIVREFTGNDPRF